MKNNQQPGSIPDPLDPEQPFDVIVVGLGAMGSATLYQLARRGARVLGIDRFAPPHERGSSHGDTRLTRLAIGEGAHYVPLALRSHEIWRELEHATGEELLTECGGLFFLGDEQVSPVHGATDFIGETVAAAQAHGLAHELLDLDQLRRRFPQFHYHGKERGYFEAGAGFVAPERCIRTQLAEAQRLGAHVRTGEPVLAIDPAGTDLARVRTQNGEFRAEKVVLTVGAWVSQFLPPTWGPWFEVYRQLLFWFEVDGDGRDFEPEQFPVFIRTDRTKEDLIYGFPAVDGPQGGIKIASEQYGQTCDPDVGTAPVTEAEIRAMYERSSRHIRIGERCLRAAACLFTVTPDGEFVLDYHPDHPELIIASPCSGHGFKHSAAIGQLLSELALDGSSTFNREPYRIDRFS